MQIGHIIKQERIKQGLKQSVLAKGICSPAHLSKIENNFLVPSKDIKDLLLKKLGVEISENSLDKEKSMVENVSKLYKQAIMNKNLEKPNSEIPVTLFTDFEDFCNVHLKLIRIKLINRENVDEQLDSMKALSPKLNLKQKFILLINVGIDFYYKKQFKKALDSFEECFEIVGKEVIEEWERADYYYMLSLTYLACNKNYSSIELAMKALQYYKENMVYNRAIDAFILLGISYKRLENFEEALDYFLKAEKVAETFNYNICKGIILQNIGSLYSARQESEKSIAFYKKSLELEGSLQNQLNSILSLIKEYSKLKDSTKTIRWCEKGLSFIESDINHSTSFLHHFNIYLHMHKHNDELLNVLKSAIMYFEKVDDRRHVYKYSLLLARLFSKQCKYKSAFYFLHKANEFQNKNIAHWEDL